MSVQASFIEGDTSGNFPLFPEWTPWVIFGYGNWPDTDENRKIIVEILEGRKVLQAWVEHRQAETRQFIDEMLKSSKR